MEDSGNRKATLSFSLPSVGFIVWLILLIIKLVGAAEISWFWVWFPFWLPWAIIGGILIICLIIVGIAAACGVDLRD